MRDIARESGDYIRGYEDAVVDARLAVEAVRSHYPEDVFPATSQSPDARSARMARLTCDNVLRELENQE